MIFYANSTIQLQNKNLCENMVVFLKCNVVSSSVEKVEVEYICTVKGKESDFTYSIGNS